MKGPLTAVAASCLVVALTLFASPLSPAQAMPAPEPGNRELSAGLAQWGAETEIPEGMNRDEFLESLLKSERPTQARTSKTAMCETLATAARVHELPVGFFVRLINQESGFNPQVVSSAGAQGVAQFMPKVAEEWGLKNPFDPHAALVASARFLRSLYQQFGNWGLAAAAYNGGMGRVQKWIDKRGKLPDETRHYVMTITGVPAEKWADRSVRDAKFSIPPRAPCQEIAHLADKPGETVPVKYQVVAQAVSQGGASPKVGIVAPVKTVTIAKIKGGTKVAVIKVNAASKIAAVAAKIAAPTSIVAEAKSGTTKGKSGAKAPAVKLADKRAPQPQAKTRQTNDKKTKGRVQVADASGARK